MRPPRLWRAVCKLDAPLREFVQRVATEHYELGNPEAELTSEYAPICASDGSVSKHTDDMGGVAAEHYVYGLVVRSDGHALYSDSLGSIGLPLQEGDVYCIDTRDPHWTVGSGELIFLAMFLRFDDPRVDDEHRIALDLVHKATHSMALAESRRRMDAAAERYRYRGIANV